MTIQKLRELYRARPFRPFIIHVADGRFFGVHHPDYLAVDPNGRTVIVIQLHGGFDIIDLRLVTALEVKPERGESAA